MASKKAKKTTKKSTEKKTAKKASVKKSATKKPEQVKADGVTKVADRTVVVHAEQDQVLPVVTH